MCHRRLCYKKAVPSKQDESAQKPVVKDLSHVVPLHEPQKTLSPLILGQTKIFEQTRDAINKRGNGMWDWKKEHVCLPENHDAGQVGKLSLRAKKGCQSIDGRMRPWWQKRIRPLEAIQKLRTLSKFGFEKNA
ncbi:MAG: hypothetical protein KF851_11585 [Pirellulaceae bacterium]|nr:hypothetical protein [Pirellulaceae bacterium]